MSSPSRRKTVLVTGAGSGVSQAAAKGRATAYVFGEAGRGLQFMTRRPPGLLWRRLRAAVA